MSDPSGGVRVLAPTGLRVVKDIAAATAACLRSPSDFVPLTDAVIEGDHVAIAAEAEVPHLPEVLRGVLECLPMERLGGLAIVLPEGCPASLEAAVRDVAGETAKVVIHQPNVQEELAYLAADDDGEPVYMNRTLVEADFVLPIVVGRPVGTLRPAYTLGGVYPTFSGRTSFRNDLQRRVVASSRDANDVAEKAAQEANWLLGLLMVLTVVPAEKGKVAGIFAGTASGLQRDAGPLLEAGWRRSSHICSRLVIVGFHSESTPPSFASIADGVHAALDLTDTDGALVLCLPDVQLTGIGFDLLAAEIPHEEVLKKLIEVGTEEAKLCAVLATARDRCRLYVYGVQNEKDQLESMGLFPIEVDEMERLITQQPHPVVFNDGQFCVTGPEGD